MASLEEEARAFVVLADYANTDAAGKLNLLGGGWQVTALTQTGLTIPHAVTAAIEVPERFAGVEFSVSLTLIDESGEQVKVPGPSGNLEALRIGQVTKAERPNVPGVLLHGKVWCRVQVILNFTGGLPLAPGQSYTWNLEISGHHDSQWCAGFYVAAPPQAIIG